MINLLKKDIKLDLNRAYCDPAPRVRKETLIHGQFGYVEYRGMTWLPALYASMPMPPPSRSCRLRDAQRR